MPSDKDRIALLEYKVGHIDKAVAGMMTSVLALTNTSKGLAEEVVEEKLFRLAILSVLAKEIPTFNTSMATTLTRMASGIEDTRSS